MSGILLLGSPESRRSIYRTFFDPAELETRGFLCSRSCIHADCHVVDPSALHMQSDDYFVHFDRAIVSSGLVFLSSRLWARQCGPCLPSTLFVHCVKYEALLQHVPQGLTAATIILYISKWGVSSPF